MLKTSLIYLALLTGYPAFAQDEPVGWPLKKTEEKKTEEKPDQQAPEQKPFEVAPLEVFRPAIKPLHFVYPEPYVAFTLEEGEALENLALRLIGTNDKILITAYAGNEQTPVNEAVQKSFRRALIVRGFLIEEGVLPEQIDLKALGQAEDSGPAERIDITPLSQ